MYNFKSVKKKGIDIYAWSTIAQFSDILHGLNLNDHPVTSRRFCCIKSTGSKVKRFGLNIMIMTIAMTLVTLFSLKTMESLQNRIATHFQTNLLFSIRTV